MKKVIILSFIGFVLCTAFYSPQVSIIDYRDCYVGKYLCTNSTSRFQGSTATSSISTDTITIFITKDVSDSLLQINIAQQIMKVKLVNKTLKAFPLGGHYGGKFYATDSLDFNYSQGRAFSSRCFGKKKTS